MKIYDLEGIYLRIAKIKSVNKRLNPKIGKLTPNRDSPL